MFGKLKDKLKSALSIFSKKAEEVAEEKKIENVVEEKKVEAVIEDKAIETEVSEKIIIKEEKKEKFVKEEKTKPKISEQKKKEEKIGVKEERIEEHRKTEIKEKEVVKEIKPIQKQEAIKEPVKEEKKIIKEERIPEKQIIKEKAEPIKQTFKEEVAEEQPKKSFFGRIKEFVTTKTISAEKFEELFWDLELALLENNVSVEVIEKIKENLKNELVDKPLPRDVPAKIEETLKETLTEILTFESVNLSDRIKKKKPYIIAFFGINGSGKTTSIAKLAYYLQQKGLSVVLAAADTFRAAAIDQLEEHANKLKVKMIKHAYGSDAAAVAVDAVKYAEKNKIDVVLIDTAGRLHSNTNLMAELEKIIRINKPDLKIFVGESITGNDCIEQARKFNELVELDGSILTKADVDEKGGAPLSIAYTIKKPILFLGTGQKYSDLEEFEAETILEKLGF